MIFAIDRTSWQSNHSANVGRCNSARIWTCVIPPSRRLMLNANVESGEISRTDFTGDGRPASITSNKSELAPVFTRSADRGKSSSGCGSSSRTEKHRVLLIREGSTCDAVGELIPTKVCRKCAAGFISMRAKTLLSNTRAVCSRAGLINGKLLFSQSIRSGNCLRRSDGRIVGMRLTSGLLVTRPRSAAALQKSHFRNGACRFECFSERVLQGVTTSSSQNVRTGCRRAFGPGRARLTNERRRLASAESVG
jgi:hypothetical protein